MPLRPASALSDHPLPLADAKADLQLTHALDDAKLQMAIDGAVNYLSGRHGILGRQLGTQDWDLVLDAFPSGPIQIPLPPLKEVLSITYLDAAGQSQTLAPAAYVVDAASEPGWVAPADAWPATYGTLNAVTVRFRAGYGAATPGALKSALLLLVRDLYEDQPGRSDAAVDRLTFPHRMLSP